MTEFTEHASDCAVHNEPALPAGPCDCEITEMLCIDCGGIYCPPEDCKWCAEQTAKELAKIPAISKSEPLENPSENNDLEQEESRQNSRNLTWPEGLMRDRIEELEVELASVEAERDALRKIASNLFHEDVVENILAEARASLKTKGDSDV